jgi:hypothetical protein
MNYERLRFTGRSSDWCGDDLPPAGSVRDIARYLSNDVPRATRLGRLGTHPSIHVASKSPAAAGVQAHADRASVALELRAYIDNASRPDFGRRARVQRADMVKALVTLSGRLRNVCMSTLSAEEHRLITAAGRLIARWRLQ